MSEQTNAPEPTAATAAAPKTQSAATPVSKSSIVLKMLGRARGATVAEVQEATGWQPHSVRAFLSGRRKAGLSLGKEERKSGETSYRTVTVAKPAAEPSA
jgi:hypothetical protein